MRISPLPICALIPTYNNGGTIVDVVRRTYAYLRDIIVVVDGCTDDTLEQLQQLDFPITIVAYKKNRGKGYALKKGFQKAKEMGFEYALTLDSDGQHYPEDIPLLVKALYKTPQALIVGNRGLNHENMPNQNKFANRLSNFFFRLQTGVNLPDTQTGMRIYPLQKLSGLSLLTSRYEAELALLVWAAWHDVLLIPVPIRVYYPPKEERISHFRPFYDFLRITILNTFLTILAVVYGYPRLYWKTIYCFAVWGPLMLFVVQPLSLLYFLLFGKNAKTRLTYHRFVSWFAKWCIDHIPGLYVQVHNDYGHVFGNKTMLYICNHQSVLDIIVLLSLMPKSIILTKGWVWNNPVLCVLLRLLDCFPIYYDEAKKRKKILSLLQEGYSIVIFPEGTRTRTGEIGRFHQGAVRMAEEYGLDICPILVQGMFHVLNKNQFRVRGHDVNFFILPEISITDTTFGNTCLQKSKTLELYYHNRMEMNNNYTVTVLGGGVGGLFTGALLADKGFDVTILEQLPVAGGGLYSFEKDGEIWQTGMHIVCGLEEGGRVKAILDHLNISVPLEETTMDNSPAPLIGEKEWSYYKGGTFRFVGGSKPLIDALCMFIIRHGGRVLTDEKVEHLTIQDNKVVEIKTQQKTFKSDIVVSSLHPKKLLELTETPIFRQVTIKRIQETPETEGSFKLYLKLKPSTLPFDKVSHYLPDVNLLVLTPPCTQNEEYARTIECVTTMPYDQLTPWQANRKDDYASYEAFKEQKAAEVLQQVKRIYPNIESCIESHFTSTSLTFRDDFLTPEGGMYGMSEALGAVITKVDNLYLTGQNCHLRGLCGTVMTSKEVAEKIGKTYG